MRRTPRLLAPVAELMLGWELRSYSQAAAQDAPVLMDRAIPDIIGYLTLCRLPAPPHLARAAALHRYNRTVFIAPYWEAIYSRDAERKQDRTEAEATCRIMAETYSGFGYRLIELPFADIDQRTDFILAHMNG